MDRIAFLPAISALFLLSALAVQPAIAAASLNLLTNGGMESERPGAVPTGWEALRFGPPANIRTDAQERRGGATSGRIDAAEVTRSYLRSTAPIPVAPGEAIRISAWVKVRDIPAEQGNVILIAEFTTARGVALPLEKVCIADISIDSWQHLERRIIAPEQATQLRLRTGLSYSKGICWWDDVTVEASHPIVCRVDLPKGRLSPGSTSLPVLLLNRREKRSRVAIQAGDQKMIVDLNGEPAQRVEVPIPVVRPGRRTIALSITEEGEPQPVFSHSATLPVAPPIVLAPPSPTHWVVEDGAPVIEGMVELAVSDAERQGSQLVTRIADAAGKIHAEWTSVNPPESNAFTLKAPALPEGNYSLIAELQSLDAAKRPHREQHTFGVIRRSAAHVSVNDAGFPVCEGKAIFPMGIFNGGRFKEQAAAGFTVTHAYNAARIADDPIAADIRAFDFIEKTHVHGMKMLFQIPMRQAIEGDFETIRRRIRMFRNHPGLLAWDEEEGFARGDFKPDTLKTLRAIVDKEDPHHPLMVGDSSDVTTRVRGQPNFFPDADMDLGMWWWYPFPLRAPRGNQVADEDGNELAARWDVLTPPAFLTRSATTKPIWVGIQAYRKAAKDARYPTPDEYRTQAYLAIASGARGLMWYGGGVTGGMFIDTKEGHWNDLQKLVGELRDREAFWTAPVTESPVITPPDALITAAVKRLPDGRSVVVAVNRGPDAVDATVAGISHGFESYGVLVRESPH